jgi:hypothetical protein
MTGLTATDAAEALMDRANACAIGIGPWWSYALL